MAHRGITHVALSLLVFACTAGRLAAQITVEGVSDKNSSYTDTATFRVLSEVGYEYTAWLNGSPVPLDAYVTVDKPDYYELFVRRVQNGTGTETTLLTRFIIQSSNRGAPERGLIEWTPYPLTHSASNEFAGAQLNLMMPQNYPQGLEIPVIAMVDDGLGNEQRMNGEVAITGHTASHDLKILRGHGSLLLPAAPDGSPLNLGFNLHTLSENQVLTPDDSTPWTTVSGTLAGTTTWPANSRIHLTADVTIPAAAHLTVGAGTVVKLDPLVNIYVDGQITINGTTADPVVWAATGPVAPEQHTHAWGGFLIRGSSAVLNATGSIMFGGGGATSFDFQSSASHRSEQPVLFIYDGAEAHLTNCAIINTAGQIGNGYKSEIIFDHCLFQRAITAGEYTGIDSLFIADHCAIIEFPEDNGQVTPSIANADYDALYFTEGEHILRNSLIGFCKDDAIDSGSGGAGTMVVSNCWIEAALHEALAWSYTGRETWTYDSVLMNSGQGIESGFSGGSSPSPLCYAENLLSLNNSVGARFGDNYDWTYNGYLQVTNSLLLHNYRDVFGRNWADWAWRTAQMDLRGNLITTEYAEHPDNTLWDPAADAALLAPFMTTPPEAPVGIGIALWTNQLAMAELVEGVPVRLSSFTTNNVAVNYEITDATPATLATRTVVFAAGETLKRIYATDFNLQDLSEVRVILSNPVNGELTGETMATFLGSATLPELSLAGVAEPVVLGRRMQEGVFLFLNQPSAGLVSVDYTYESSGLEIESGTFVFDPPATWQSVMPQGINPFDYSHLNLTISNATGAVLSGVASVTFTNPPLAIGFASAESQMDLTSLSNGLPVVLTGPAPAGVSVDYTIDGTTGNIASGTLNFVEGETVAWIPAPLVDFMQYDLLRVTLSNPAVAPLSEPSTIYLVRPGPTPPSPIVMAAGASWYYWDAGTDLGSVWRSNAYDSATWPEGPAQLGFGEGDEATTIADNDQITSYFRHSFVMEDPATLDELSLWVLRDDGAVVYINGAEVFRSPNMPTGTIGYLTLAQTPLGENTEDTATISASVLQAGTNWVAVEIHQQAAASSDVSFDLELEIKQSSSSLVAIGAAWKYRDAASAAPAGWKDISFDDGAWAEGPAQLGYGEGDEATEIADNDQITSYFRRTFIVDDPTVFADLSMWMLRDDGGVVYLNGTEVFRSPNMPAGTIDYLTLAQGSSVENVEDTATISASALHAGTNCVAVEIHQQAVTSSDVSFDFELVGEPSLPAPPQHVYLGKFETNMVIAWSHPDFILEEADQLTGPWSPAATNSPLMGDYEYDRKFYRLRLQ